MAGANDGCNFGDNFSVPREGDTTLEVKNSLLQVSKLKTKQSEQMLIFLTGGHYTKTIFLGNNAFSRCFSLLDVFAG